LSGQAEATGGTGLEQQATKQHFYRVEQREGCSVFRNYVRETLGEALDILVGTKPIQDRLAYVADYLSTRLRVEEILDSSQRAEFADVLRALTDYPAEREGEGSIGASVRKLTDAEGAALARKLRSIYSAICR
jgi:hypothetical protein